MKLSQPHASAPRAIDTLLPNGHRAPWPLARMRRTIIGTYLLLISFIVVATVRLAWLQHHEELQRLTLLNAGMTHILEEHATRTLGEVDKVLLGIEQSVNDAGGLGRLDEKTLHDLMRRRHENLPQVQSFHILNASGQLLARSAQFPAPKLDMSASEPYRFHVGDATPGMRVFPTVQNPISGAAMLPVARRIQTADERFVGLVGGAVSIAYLTNFYDAVQLPPGVALSIVRADGVTLFRYPRDDGRVGRRLTDSPLFKGERPAAMAGTFIHTPLTDGIERLVSYHWRTDGAYALTVSMPLSNVLASWKPYVRRLLLSSVLTCMVFGILFAFIYRQLRHRERTETRLAQTQYAIDHAQDMMAWLDSTNHIRYANKAMCERHGYSPDELIGSHVSLIDRQLTDEFLVPYWETMRQHGSFRTESEHTTKLGEVFPVEALASHVMFEGVEHSCTTLRDISERKHAEAEIRELTRTLEQRVIDRTTELQQTVREMEAFAYSISHDLRAPLRAINGFSQVIVETEHTQLSEQGRSLLERIIKNSNRMGDLIDDILEYSRSSRSKLNKQIVDMEQLAQAVVREQQEFYPKAKVRIGPLPRVEGDVTMLRQILANLVDNALKYSSNHEAPEMDIGAEDRALDTLFYVKDNGAGFDMAYAGKLFGVFQRLHKEAEFPGTGVGLAIVKRLVERHGGRIWAEAEPNGGACFYFTLRKNYA